MELGVSEITVEDRMILLLTPVCLSGAQRGPEGRAGMENRSFTCWDLSCSRRKARAVGLGSGILSGMCPVDFQLRVRSLCCLLGAWGAWNLVNERPWVVVYLFR